MTDKTQTVPMFVVAMRLRNSLIDFERAKSDLMTCDELDSISRAQAYQSAKSRYVLAEHDFKRLNREVRRLGKWGSIEPETGSVS